MKKIALIEHELSGQSAALDKIISFSTDNYISVDGYITEQELSQVYDQTFLEVNSWLVFNRDKKVFTYDDIDILWAYGREIFEFVLNIRRKVYIVKKIIEEETPEELWIAPNNDGLTLKKPTLDFFLKDFIPSDLTLKFLNRVNLKSQPRTHSTKKEKPLFLESITKPIRYLPNIFKRKFNGNVLIFSDLDKMLTILDHLDPQRTIFIREDLPERLILYFLKKGINLMLFSDFKLSITQEENIASASKQLINLLQESLSELKIENLYFTSYLKKHLYQTWSRELPHVLKKLAQMQIMCKRFEIRSVLLDADRTVTANLLTQVSRQHNCRSYVNCHGEPFLNKIGYLPLTADHIFVWGIEQKNFLQRWNLEANRIIVSGSTKHDRYLIIEASEAKEKICNDLNLPKQKKLILFGWCFIKRRNDMLKTFTWQKIKQSIGIVSNYPDANIIIKMHPRDTDTSLLEDCIKALGCSNIIILKNYNPLLLAKGADLLIVYSSTFSTDGLALGKPVILLDNVSMERYANLNFFYDGTTTEKLKAAVKNIIEGSAQNHITNWKAAADYCLNGMDGTASKRIADILSQ